MIHIIVGTRAQIIKMAPVMKELENRGINYNFIFLAQHKETMYEIMSQFGIKKPDIVIVDYADLLRSVTMRKEARHDLESIYEDLRGLAGEYEVPVFTASQANRSALDEDVIEASKVAESYSKVMTADFVISLSRKIEDKIGNTGRFHVIKNRFGPDGLTYPAKINTNIGKIEIFENNSVQGKGIQNKINNRDNQTKAILSARYEDLMND